jgi:hypothetical protein
MFCPHCGSDTQSEFAAEINLCFGGLKNIHIPGFRTSPSVLTCLECGFSRFTLPQTELARLAFVLREVMPQPEKGELRDYEDAGVIHHITS